MVCAPKGINVLRIGCALPDEDSVRPVSNTPVFGISTALEDWDETKMGQLKAEAMLREFQYNGIRIPDPGPDLTVDQVRDLLTPQFPEVATASVSGAEVAGSVLRYTFSRAIGTKG
jgi:PRTRC genetic system protein C